MFRFTNIKDYQQNLLNGQTTCVEAVQHYLATASAKQHLNAWLELFADEALQRAADLDALQKQNEPLGKLHGVIIGIKDVLAYTGHRLTASSKILDNFTSIFSATAIERILAEGAIIIGRQNCDEFAMGSSNENSAFGIVKNAQDETKVPGGSSGGSAVAVQADMCMVSLGSDTGGSVRQPADFCGIIGFKPSYGRISRYGLIAYASSFDSIGILAKTIPDVAITLEVIAGADEFDSTVSQKEVPAYAANLVPETKPLKLAYFKQAIENEALDPEIKAAFLSFTKNLTEAGHSIQVIDFELIDYIVPTYYVLTTAEASSNLSRYDGVRFGHRTKTPNTTIAEMYALSRSEGFGTEVKRRIMLGNFVLSAGYFDAYFTKAQQVRQLLLQQLTSIFNSTDLLLSPTVPATAWSFGEKSNDPTAMYLADIYTVLANLTGMPAVSLPLFTHSNGMPFGLQVMSSAFDELSLLRFSAALVQKKQ